MLSLKSTSNEWYYITFGSIFYISDILDITLEGVEISAWYQNYIKRGILHTFYGHISLLRRSGTRIKKELKFLLCMKTISNRGYYVTFKSICAFSDILEHDFKKELKFLLGMKTA